MSNTINVNYMSVMMNRLSRSVSKESGADSKPVMSDAFENAIAEKSGNVEKSDTIKSISKEDMTLEEYREYISDKIADFPLHPSQIGNSFAINISDVSLQKMKDDPEYEEWLLNDVKSALGSTVPGWYQAIGGPNTYCVLNYENGEKGCLCHMWSKGYKGGAKSASDMFDDESRNSIHKRKAEQKKRIEKEAQKKADLKKKQAEKELAEIAAKKRYNHQQMMQEYYNEWLANNSLYAFNRDMTANLKTTSMTTGSAISSYEASFVTLEPTTE